MKPNEPQCTAQFAQTREVWYSVFLSNWLCYFCSYRGLSDITLTHDLDMTGRILTMTRPLDSDFCITFYNADKCYNSFCFVFFISLYGFNVSKRLETRDKVWQKTVHNTTDISARVCASCNCLAIKHWNLTICCLLLSIIVTEVHFFLFNENKKIVFFSCLVGITCTAVSVFLFCILYNFLISTGMCT